MAAETNTTWTCDRPGCGNSFTTPGTKQPMNWGATQYVMPPLASFEDSQRFHLCPDCRAFLRDWLRGPDGPIL